MMRSTFTGNNNDDDEDDLFGPNPFRSSDNDTDLLGTPNTSNAPPVQQPYGQPYGGGGPPANYTNYGNTNNQQQQQFDAMQPDPVTGMTGTLDHFPPPPQPRAPPRAADPTQYLSGPMDQANTPEQQQPAVASIFSWRGILSSCWCCNVETLTQLFDVDSVDIYWRLRGAATQFWLPDQFRTAVLGDSSSTQDNSDDDGNNIRRGRRNNNKGPDLYGPFWIGMTLVFVLGMTSNLSDYLHHQRNKASPDEEFEYDITHLLRAMYVVAIFGWGVPTAFWLACSCMGMPAISWALWVCCYGYSMVPILLGALAAWWLPYELWHWIVLAMAVAASGLLVVRNLSSPLLSQDSANHAKAAPVVLAILGAQFCYLLVLKITFYP